MRLHRTIKREAERLARKGSRRYERQGCARCGEYTTIGAVVVLEGGVPVCELCRSDADQVVGTVINTADHSAGVLADTAWYRANPDAEWRLRRPFPGELLELARREKYVATALGLGEPRETVAVEQPPTHVFVLRLTQTDYLRRPCAPPSDPPPRIWVNAMRAALGVAAHFRGLRLEKLDADAVFRAKNAAAILASPAADVIMDEARAQGAAMAESRQATRQ